MHENMYCAKMSTFTVNKVIISEANHIENHIYTSTPIHKPVLEMKVLCCAPAGCKDSENGAPSHLSMCYSLYKPILNLEKPCTHRVHRCQDLCTRQLKCAHRVQGAPLISNTASTHTHTHTHTHTTEQQGRTPRFTQARVHDLHVHSQYAYTHGNSQIHDCLRCCHGQPQCYI